MPQKIQMPEDQYFITESCYVQLRTQTLFNNGKSRKLRGKTWALLYCLMQRHDSIVPYDEIREAVWPNNDYSSWEKLPNAIAQIKKRLRDDCFGAVGVTGEEVDQVLQAVSSEGMILHPYRPITISGEELASDLQQAGIGNQEYLEIIDCLMHVGLSGRMGREQLIGLAKGGNKLAALELGELYYYGYITRNHRPDFEKACEWYKKAGDHPVALWTLGYCIMNNYYPVVDPEKIDYLAARNYFDRAIKVSESSGIFAAAMTSIGQLWETGHYPAADFSGTGKCEKKNLDRALAYYKMADKDGYHYATNRLGLYHEKKAKASPSSAEENQKLAFSYFSRSVSLVPAGYALNKLGGYYEQGFGCTPNPDMACRCYMRGVEEPLEDDITGWNYFNAARVCANRIPQQPQSYFDFSRAFSYFDEALRRLPAEKHGQILLEMMDVLLLFKGPKHELAVPLIQTRAWIRRYLHEASSSSPAVASGSDLRIRETAALVQIKARDLEELMADGSDVIDSSSADIAL